MTFIQIKIPLLFTLIYLSTSIQQPCDANTTCPHQSTCVVESNYCKCNSGYIGMCSMPALLLTNQPQISNLTNSLREYYYIEPVEAKIFLEITINICQIGALQDLTLYFWTENGHEYEYTPYTTFISPITKVFQQNCTSIILSQYYFLIQLNGYTQRLVVGIQSNNDTTLQIAVNQRRSLVIYISYYATLFVMILLLVSFFGSMVLTICRRNRVTRLNFARNHEEQNQDHNIDYFQEYLPKKKLQDIIRQQNIVCPICLQTIEDSQFIRQTPCEHVFHSCCLDSWCVKNVSCPVCRTELTQDLVKAIKDSLQTHSSNRQSNKYMANWQQQFQMSIRTKQGEQIRQTIL